VFDLLVRGLVVLMGDAHLDEVDFGEARVVARFLDVEDGDDVLVVEVAEQLHFAESAQAEHGVVEGGDLLDCDFLP
jgi:hypothetical protein